MRATNKSHDWTGDTEDWRLFAVFAGIFVLNGLGWALMGVFLGFLIWGWG